jgi:hypothetical protein
LPFGLVYTLQQSHLLHADKIGQQQATEELQATGPKKRKKKKRKAQTSKSVSEDVSESASESMSASVKM